MKKTLFYVITLTLVAMLALTGCSSTPGGDQTSTEPSAEASAPAEASAAAPEEGEGDKIVIGFSNWSRKFEFYKDMEVGMQEAADQLGIELVMQDADGDLATQTSQLENYVSRKMDGIIIVPIDSEAAASEIEMVNQAGISILTVDIACTGGGEIESHIASDNYLGGQLAAEYIGEALGGKGKVAVLNNPTITPLIDRSNGFIDTIKEKYPDIEIVAEQSGESDREKGMSVTENILEKTPDLDAIFGTNDMMALGAVQAVQIKQADTIVVGFDATEEACNAMLEGGPMKASIAQQPKLLGSTALETLMKVLNGEAVETEIMVEVMTISVDNVKEFVGQ